MAPVNDSANSFALRADVSIQIGMFVFTSYVDSHHECYIILPFVR